MHSSRLKILILSLLCAATSACSSSQSGTGAATVAASQGVATNSGTGYTCSYTEIDQFPVFSDPTQNFSPVTTQETSTVQNSNCNGVTDGMQINGGNGSISRSGNLISLGSGSDGIELSGSLAAIPQQDLQQCSSGVQATGTLQSVQLDSVGDEIFVVTSWNLVNNGCTQAVAASGQSAPAAVDTNTFTLPSSLQKPDITYVYLQSSLVYQPATSTLASDQWTYTYSTINPTATNSVITVTGSDANGSVNNSVEVTVRQGDIQGWSMQFWAPAGNALLGGNYPNAATYPGSPTVPNFQLYGSPWSVQSSSFQILGSSFQQGNNGIVDEFEASFVASDSSGNTLQGMIAYFPQPGTN